MVYLPMKRDREGDLDSLTTMANCLMLLSRGGGDTFETTSYNSPSRVFECKTCNRQFPSFQALGGHRASHKKPRPAATDLTLQGPTENSPPAKPKTHECSICGLEFAIGQALGGHMRRHRAGLSESHQTAKPSPSPAQAQAQAQAPVVKKANSRRVLCLDLNLTPYENDLEFRLGKVAPMVDCYL